MKKRLLSTLLTVCMVAALFSGFSVTASADSNTIEHTLAPGETVIGICQKYGIDFYANYRWITEKNKITNYGNLKPGRVIILPKPGTTPGNPSKPSTPPSNSNSSPHAGSAGTAIKLIGNDYINGYYVHHVMKSGETVGGICLALGVDFASHSAEIKRVNNIKDYNRIYVGRVIKIPVSTPPKSGVFTAIVAHRVVSGDAMMNICNSYGLNYSTVLPELQAINNRKDNFSSIKVGQIILLPVQTTAAAQPPVTPGGGGTVTPGSGGSSSGGNSSGGGSTTPSNPSDGKTYKITALTTNHGSYEVQVDGKKVTEAKSGTTVSVVATPAWDHQLGNITVTCGNKKVPVNDGKFVMPSGNVKVSVSFVSHDEYEISKASTVNGQFSCLVNGNDVSKAAAGLRVTVKPEPKYGYELDSISVTSKKDNGEEYAVNVSGNGSFTMPDANVSVAVSFKRAAEHKISLSPPSDGGSYEVRINGKSVSEAYSGETIKIVAFPDKDNGYKFAGATVNTAGGREINVEGNVFIMPEDDIVVSVKFVKD